ncbi:MAG: D-aminoacylase [Chloroflexota bacterium]
MKHDLIIRNGTIYDGLGGDPFEGDIAISGGQIQEIGPSISDSGQEEIDAHGLAVSPGFINMLSWACEALIIDGRSQSDIRQGVTLEVMGEGYSYGPFTDEMAAAHLERRGNKGRYEVTWRTLRQYLDFLVNKGVSCNVASFVGSGTLRVHAIGYDDREPSADELNLMRDLVRQSMAEGAVGLSAALVYPPASFAKTEELIALCQVVSEFDGLYISHLRSEGDAFLEGIDELFDICRAADVRGQIYHLKAAGKDNWHKMDAAIAKVEAARAAGREITADMYLYPAGGTGLRSITPGWAQDGGVGRLIERLKDPETRAKIKAEMHQPSTEWENFWRMAGDPARIQISHTQKPELRHLIGQTIAEIAAERGTAPDETALDLLVEDGGLTSAVYFMMTEENIEKQVALPWLSFDSDASSQAPEGVFLESSTHPRAYGNFARLLGRYVRDKQIIPLEEAVRKLTSFPAQTLRIKDRGRLAPGYWADVAIFDPATIQDHATFAEPQQFSTGVRDVIVNGVPVLRDGEHTNAMPGRVVVPNA